MTQRKPKRAKSIWRIAIAVALPGWSIYAFGEYWPKVDFVRGGGGGVYGIAALAANPVTGDFLTSHVTNPTQQWIKSSGYVSAFSAHPQYGLDISQDGRRLVAGNDFGFEVVDLLNGSIETSVRIDQLDSAWTCAISGDGAWVVTGGYGGTLLWTREGALLRTINSERAKSVRFAGNGLYVCVLTESNVLKVYDPLTGLLLLQRNAVALDTSQNDSLLAYADQATVSILDGNSLKTLTTWPVDRTLTLGIPGSGDFLFFQRFGDHIELWDWRNQRRVWTTQGNGARLTQVAVDKSTGNFVAIGGSRFLEFDKMTGAIREISAHKTLIQWGSTLLDGRFLTASEDATVKSWSASTGESLRTYVNGNEQIQDVAFSPTGDKMLYSVRSGGEQARLRDLGTGVVMSLAEPITSGCFSTDGALVWISNGSGLAAYRASDFSLVLRNTALGDVWHLRALKSKPELVGYRNGQVVRIDSTTGSQIASFPCPADSGIALLDDETRIVTGSSYVFRVSDLQKGLKVAGINFNAQSLVADADGRTFWTYQGQRWTLDLELIDEVQDRSLSWEPVAPAPSLDGVMMANDVGGFALFRSHPDPVAIRADSFDATGVTINSGTVSDIAHYDRRWLEVQIPPGPSVRADARTLEFQAISPTAAPRSLALVYGGFAVTYQEVGARLELFDWNTKSWSDVSRMDLGDTVDLRLRYADDPARFVRQSDGLMRGRVRFIPLSWHTNLPIRYFIDQLSFSVRE